MSQTPPPAAFPPPPPYAESDQRTYAMLVHILGIFFGLWPALIGYLITKDRGGFIRDHTRRALNFHLTALIAYVAGAILSIVIVGFFLIIATAIVAIVFEIVAAIASRDGLPYKYPISIEFIKP